MIIVLVTFVVLLKGQTSALWLSLNLNLKTTGAPKLLNKDGFRQDINLPNLIKKVIMFITL